VVFLIRPRDIRQGGLRSNPYDLSEAYRHNDFLEDTAAESPAASANGTGQAVGHADHDSTDRLRSGEMLPHSRCRGHDWHVLSLLDPYSSNFND